MKIKNKTTIGLMIMSVIMLFTAWGVSTSYAQYGSKQQQGQMKPAEQAMSNANSYILYIPASGKTSTCQDIKSEFSSTMGNMTGKSMGMDHGSDPAGSMSQVHGWWEWGCSSDDKALYVLTMAPSEKDALNDVPADLRKQAEVINLSSLSGEQMHQHQMVHGMNSHSSDTEKSEIGYLIYIPATEQFHTCQEIRNELSSKMDPPPGSDMKQKSGAMNEDQHDSEWGCSSNNRALYLFTRATTEKDALGQVPSDLRGRAKVIRMSGPSHQEMQHMTHDTKSKSSMKSNY